MYREGGDGPVETRTLLTAYAGYAKSGEEGEPETGTGTTSQKGETSETPKHDEPDDWHLYAVEPSPLDYEDEIA